MSVIDCPQCGKKTSSLAPICDHCGYSEGETSEENLQRYRERKIRRHLYRLNMASYAIMTMVILAFGWYWIATDSFQVPSGTMGPYYLMMAGAVAYLAVRAMLFRARRQQKEIWRGR
jgi:hypothetical protein